MRNGLLIAGLLGFAAAVYPGASPRNTPTYPSDLRDAVGDETGYGQLDSLPALSYTAKTPDRLNKFCSGSLVRSRSWDRPMFLTAQHCFPGISGGVYDAYASGKFLGLSNLDTKALVFNADAAQVDNTQDLLLAPITGGVSAAARIFRLAEKLPEPGEKIAIWGYPSGLISASLINIDCAYLGAFFVTSPYGPGFTILQAAQCSRKYSIEGMSGGPVLNSAGKLIGLISMQGVHHKVNFEGTLMIFPEITEQRVNTAPDSGLKNFIMPLRDGLFRCNPIYRFRSNDPDSIEVVKSDFEIPVLNQLAHGVQKAFGQDGNPIDYCGRYEHGRFITFVSCDSRARP